MDAFLPAVPGRFYFVCLFCALFCVCTGEMLCLCSSLPLSPFISPCALHSSLFFWLSHMMEAAPYHIQKWLCFFTGIFWTIFLISETILTEVGWNLWMRLTGEFDFKHMERFNLYLIWITWIPLSIVKQLNSCFHVLSQKAILRLLVMLPLVVLLCLVSFCFLSFKSCLFFGFPYTEVVLPHTSA